MNRILNLIPKETSGEIFSQLNNLEKYQKAIRQEQQTIEELIHIILKHLEKEYQTIKNTFKTLKSVNGNFQEYVEENISLFVKKWNIPGLIEKSPESENTTKQHLAGLLRGLFIEFEQKMNKKHNVQADLKELFKEFLSNYTDKLEKPNIDKVKTNNLTDFIEKLTLTQIRLNNSKALFRKSKNNLISNIKELEGKFKNNETTFKKDLFALAITEDGIFIDNAGLVLIAPFIRYLFRSIEYIDDQHKFINIEFQHRAVLLLQYLCAPFDKTFEYLLPLCKIVCGFSPEQLIDIEFNPNKREVSECENLIAVVIEQAGIFKKLSNGGFRDSFMLREGKLSSQNKNWLLQVEKKTHDILLEKIPWNYKIIKQPWMSVVLQVEW